jgi:hypothetical protein
MTKASTKNRFLIGGVVAAAFALASAGAATSASAGTLDQQQAEYGNVLHGVYANNGVCNCEQSVAQTFTAGITGDLDQVDLYLQKTGTPAADLNVEIYSTFDGTPDSSLATASVSPAEVDASPDISFVPVTFDPPLPVTAGTKYAIVAWTASTFNNHYLWGEEGGNPYAPGELRVQSAPEASPPVPGQWGPSGATVDMTFKTYVVTPFTEPPPGTPAPTPPAASPTGQRAAALKKCKKKKSKKARKKCQKKARRLPV